MPEAQIASPLTLCKKFMNNNRGINSTTECSKQCYKWRVRERVIMQIDRQMASGPVLPHPAPRPPSPIQLQQHTQHVR